MKNNNSYRGSMKAHGLWILALGLMPMVFGCGGQGAGGGEQAAGSEEQVASDNQQAIVEGNTLKYGEHVYTVNGEINWESADHKTPTATVTFTNVPSGYQEFEAVYKNLLGKSAQGVAAMIPMAIELYARNAEEGKRCFELICNGSATVDGIVRILKTKLEPSQYADANDPYLQRYMAAALLKGADNKNAYTPEEPYTVEMCSSPNGVKDASMSGGTVYYLYILAHGWDTFQRAVEVLQEYNSEFYKVFNCPSTYAQCKNIVGSWKGLR